MRRELPVVVYKRCLEEYLGNLSLYRPSFDKPLRELGKKEVLYPEIIRVSFEVYSDVRMHFGHIPFVARSDFPEPFIYHIQEIFDFLKKTYIDNFLDLQKVKQYARNFDNIIKRSLTHDDREIENLIRIFDGVVKENEADFGEIYFGLKKMLIDRLGKDIGKIYFNLFSTKYILDKTQKRSGFSKKEVIKKASHL